MKKLNFLSKVCWLSRASQYCDVGIDRRLTVGSPLVLHRLSQYIAVTLLLLVVGVGNAWGTDYFSDNFSTATGNSSMTSRSGWASFTRCYNHYASGVRLGTSSNTGSIKTAKIDALGTSGVTVIVRFSARGWNTDYPSLNITVSGAGTANITQITNLAQHTSTSSAVSWDEKDYYEIIITGATKNTQIQFASSTKRLILGNVSITSASDDTYRFKLVENAKDIEAGDYLVVYNNTNALNTHNGNINANTYGTYTSISTYYTSSTKSIAYNSTTEALVYRAFSTSNGYALRKAYSSEFLGDATNGTGDYLRWDRNFTTSNDEWTLGVNSIVSARNSSYAIRYYTSTPKFAIYGPAAQSAVQLFKKEVVPAAAGWKLKGSFDSWGDGYDMTGSGTVSVTRTLTANTRYEFKFVTGSDYYGNNGAIVHSVSDWTFATDEGNCVLYTGPAGDYTFSINTSTKEASITYPTVDHPNANYVYIKKGDGWSDARIYNWDSGSSDKMSDWAGSPVLATCEICGTTYYYGAAYFNKIIFRDGGSNQSNELSLDRGKWLDETTHASSWSTFATYTISFGGNGNTGGSMSDITGIACGTNQALTANAFIKTGYDFDGWKADVDVKISGSTVSAGTKFNGGVTLQDIRSDIELTAQWTPTSYSITYNSLEGATNSNPTSYTIESSNITLVDPGTRAGYTFAGWYTNEEKTTPAGTPAIATGSTGNKTFWAKWTTLTDTYKTALHTDSTGWTSYASGVTKSGAGYTIPAPSSVKKGATSSCEHTHYYFAGWVADEYKGSPADHIIAATGTTDATGTTYWAVWKKESAGGGGAATYTKVTTISEGTYLMATETDAQYIHQTTFAYAGKRLNEAVSPTYIWGDTIPVSISTGVISSKPANAKEITITLGTGDDAGYFGMYDGDKYLTMTSKGKFTFADAISYEWELNNNAYIHNKGNYDSSTAWMIILNNGNSGSPSAYFVPMKDKAEGNNGGSYYYHAFLFKKDVTYEDPKVVCEACAADPVMTSAASALKGDFSLTSVGVTATGWNPGTNCSWDEKGFVWGSSANPTVSNNKVIVATGTDATWDGALIPSGSTDPTSLSVGTTYHFRAYGKNGKDAAAYVYSADVSFTPRSVTCGSVTGGTISAGTEVSAAGKTITLTATPANSHFTFNSWTIKKTSDNSDVTSSVLLSGQTSSATFTMPDYNVTITASFDEDAYATVNFYNAKNGNTPVSSIHVYEDEKPTPPTLTDGTSGDACDATSDKHYGWSTAKWNNTYATDELMNAAQTVYTKGSNLPAIAAGDLGTTIDYYAVWAQGTGSGSAAYKKVSSALDDYRGTYLIVFETDAICFDGSLTTLDAAANYQSVSIVTSGTPYYIASTSTIDTYSFTILEGSTSGKYYIQSASEYYIGSTAADGEANELLSSTTTQYDHTISVTSGDATITGTDHVLKCFKQAGQSDRFRYYKSTAGNVNMPQLYKYDPGITYSNFLTTCCEDPELAFSGEHNYQTLVRQDIHGVHGGNGSATDEQGKATLVLDYTTLSSGTCTVEVKKLTGANNRATDGGSDCSNHTSIAINTSTKKITFEVWTYAGSYPTANGQGTYRIKITQAAASTYCDAVTYYFVDVTLRDKFVDAVNGNTTINVDGQSKTTSDYSKTPTESSLDADKNDDCHSTTRRLLGWVREDNMNTWYGSSSDRTANLDDKSADAALVAPNANIITTGSTWYAVWGEEVK